MIKMKHIRLGIVLLMTLGLGACSQKKDSSQTTVTNNCETQVIQLNTPEEVEEIEAEGVAVRFSEPEEEGLYDEYYPRVVEVDLTPVIEEEVEEPLGGIEMLGQIRPTSERNLEERSELEDEAVGNPSNLQNPCIDEDGNYDFHCEYSVKFIYSPEVDHLVKQNSIIVEQCNDAVSREDNDVVDPNVNIEAAAEVNV